MPWALGMVGKTEGPSKPADRAGGLGRRFLPAAVGILGQIAAVGGLIERRSAGTRPPKRHPQERRNPSAFAWQKQAAPSKLRVTYASRKSAFMAGKPFSPIRTAPHGRVMALSTSSRATVANVLA